MLSMEDFIESVSMEAIAAKVGVTVEAVRLARGRGYFPTSWVRGIEKVSAENGIPFSDSFFKFKFEKAEPAQ